MQKKYKLIILILIVIVVGMTIWVFVDKNNMYHIDTNNPNLIKTENGYKEELVIEETEIINKYIQEKKFRRFAPNIPQSYNIVYYNKFLEENVAIKVEKSEYDNFLIGDKIKVTRIVYYTNSGFRLDYQDIAEKIE